MAKKNGSGITTAQLIKTDDTVLTQGLFCIHLIPHCIDKHWWLAMYIAD